MAKIIFGYLIDIRITVCKLWFSKSKNKIIGKIDFGFNSSPAIILLDSNLV